jgi:hypothetical protein
LEAKIRRRRLEELAEEQKRAPIAYEPARPPLARSREEAARAALLRGYGNHAVTRILARNPPATTVAHKTGAEVDAALDASPFFKPLIADGVASGKKAEGHVHIHDAATFDAKVFAYLSGKQNPDTGKTFTDDEARAFGKEVNAYQEGREIHVHEKRGEAATTVHESMHLFAHATWMARASFNANEGATEYFTKKLCAEISLKRGDFYADQHRAVKSLVEYVGESVVAEAYFKGKVAELEAAFDKKAGESVSVSVSNWFGSLAGAEKKTGAGTFKQWLEYMEAGSYFLARMLT